MGAGLALSDAGDSLPAPECGIISQKVFIKSFFKRRFPQKFVNLFFIFVIVKDKLTDLRRI